VRYTSKKQRTRKFIRGGETKNSIIVHEYYTTPFLGLIDTEAEKPKATIGYRRNVYASSDKQQQKMHSATPTYTGAMLSVDEALYHLKHTQDSSKDISPHKEIDYILNETQIVKPTTAQTKRINATSNKIRDALNAKIKTLEANIVKINKHLETLPDTK
jgi:hypothetical protein